MRIATPQETFFHRFEAIYNECNGVLPIPQKFQPDIKLATAPDYTIILKKKKERKKQFNSHKINFLIKLAQGI